MRHHIAAFVAMAYFSTAPGAIAADYRIQPGDILELSVLGAPELQQKTRINLGGNVSFPLVDLLGVGGLIVDQALTQMRNAKPPICAKMDPGVQ